MLSAIEGDIPFSGKTRGADGKAVFVESNFEAILADGAGVGVAILSPLHGLIAGLYGEEGEKTAMIVVDEGFIIRAIPLGQNAAELVPVPWLVVLVFGGAMCGFASVEIQDTSGQAD